MIARSLYSVWPTTFIFNPGLFIAKRNGETKLKTLMKYRALKISKESIQKTFQIARQCSHGINFEGIQTETNLRYQH